MKSNEKIPLVAIIVPCYNQGQYLGECLDSVLAQTDQEWVCIVVDDGSTDETAVVAKEYCLKSDKIHYHYQENAGLPATRNKGIALTDSKYILPLDADDMLEPNYLEVVLGLFEENPDIKIAYTNCRFSVFKIELHYQRIIRKYCLVIKLMRRHYIKDLTMKNNRLDRT